MGGLEVGLDNDGVAGRVAGGRAVERADRVCDGGLRATQCGGEWGHGEVLRWNEWPVVYVRGCAMGSCLPWGYLAGTGIPVICGSGIRDGESVWCICRSSVA